MTDRHDDELGTTPPRRTVLKTAAVLGVAVPFLAACASDASTPNAGLGEQSPAPTSDGVPSGGGRSSDSGSRGSGGAGVGGGDVIATTSEVPEGGGVILAEPGIVITQPAPGDFKGFSPICTHQGCTVTSVSDGTINCPCHSSKFSITDGSVVGGPAPAPLPPMAIAVDGTDISLA